MDDYQHHRLTQALGHADGATPITVNAGDLRAALEACERLPEADKSLDQLMADAQALANLLERYTAVDADDLYAEAVELLEAFDNAWS